jgi:hypothetical protein
MLNFAKIKNINPSNLVVLSHDPVILVVHQSFKKMFCGGVHSNALHMSHFWKQWKDSNHDVG